jgi:uncharacterized protein (DUF608 family)
MAGFYMVEWGPMHDQIPHFILSFYYYTLATGDKEFLIESMPMLEKVANYMLNLGLRDGLAIIPGASGISDGGKHCTNWYDVIEFGNLDAFNNMYMISALEAMAEMMVNETICCTNIIEFY